MRRYYLRKSFLFPANKNILLHQINRGEIMKKTLLLLFLVMATINTTCSQENGTEVELQTEYGNIRIRLYDETPLHRDNFVKLVKEGFYKDQLFHRIIKDFMIQGGDPGSRAASDTTRLGTGGPGYTIPAEIVYPRYFHKRGALAAARTGNDSNPMKESSGSQFYIVVGKKYSDKELTKMEDEKIGRERQTIYNDLQNKNKDTIKAFYSSSDLDGLATFRQGLSAQAAEEAEAKCPRYTAEEREAYTKVGGAPHLDNEYTVFGEMISGWDVLEKIQKVKTSSNDRPAKDVRMNIVLIRE